MKSLVKFLGGIIRPFDSNGFPVTLLIKGDSDVKNVWGGLISLFTIFISVFLSIDTLKDYWSNTNPTVTTNTDYNLDQSIFNQSTFYMAVSFFAPVNTTVKKINDNFNDKDKIYHLNNLTYICTNCTSNNTTSYDTTKKEMNLCSKKSFDSVNIKGFSAEKSEDMLSIFRNYSYCFPENLQGNILANINSNLANIPEASIQVFIPTLDVKVDFSKVSKNENSPPTLLPNTPKAKEEVVIIYSQNPSANTASTNSQAKPNMENSNPNPKSDSNQSTQNPSNQNQIANSQQQGPNTNKSPQVQQTNTQPNQTQKASGSTQLIANQQQGNGNSQSAQEQQVANAQTTQTKLSTGGINSQTSPTQQISGNTPSSLSTTSNTSIQTTQLPTANPTPQQQSTSTTPQTQINTSNLSTSTNTGNLAPSIPKARILQTVSTITSTNKTSINTSELEKQIQEIAYNNITDNFKLLIYPKILILHKKVELDLKADINSFFKERFELKLLDYYDIIFNSKFVYDIYIKQVRITQQKNGLFFPWTSEKIFLIIDRIERNSLDNLNVEHSYFSLKLDSDGINIIILYTGLPDFLGVFGSFLSTFGLIAILLTSKPAEMIYNQTLLNQIFKFVENKASRKGKDKPKGKGNKNEININTFHDSFENIKLKTIDEMTSSQIKIKLQKEIKNQTNINFLKIYNNDQIYNKNDKRPLTDPIGLLNANPNADQQGNSNNETKNSKFISHPYHINNKFEMELLNFKELGKGENHSNSDYNIFQKGKISQNINCINKAKGNSEMDQSEIKPSGDESQRGLMKGGNITKELNKIEAPSEDSYKMKEKENKEQMEKEILSVNNDKSSELAEESSMGNNIINEGLIQHIILVEKLKKDIKKDNSNLFDLYVKKFYDADESHIKKIRKRKISWLEMLGFSFCRCSKKEKYKILQKCQDLIEITLNIDYIINKLFEINFLKSIIFNEKERSIFEFQKKNFINLSNLSKSGAYIDDLNDFIQEQKLNIKDYERLSTEEMSIKQKILNSLNSDRFLL